MTMDIFLAGVILVSILTSLVTEAVKKIREGAGKTYQANLTAGIASIVISIGVAIAYMVLAVVPLTAAMIIYIVALIFISWLCAMLGFDKVKEAFKQSEGGE